MLSRLALPLALCCALSGCAVISVADAAVTVVATTVKVGATVVGTAVDVTAAGVRAATGSGEETGKKADTAPSCPTTSTGPCPPTATP